MNQSKKKLQLSVVTVQTLEPKAAPVVVYEDGCGGGGGGATYVASSDAASHYNVACPVGQIAAVAYY